MLNDKEKLEARLANTEQALLSLWSLLQDTVPPAYGEGIDKMMNDYFDANTKLGSKFGFELE